MDTTNDKGAPSNGAPPKTPHGNSNSAHAQRQRLLERLRVSPVSTITARRELDILGVAQRIIELRRHHKIDTVRTRQQTDCGKVHSVALYVLLPGGMSDD